jgi:hypothetical protein
MSHPTSAMEYAWIINNLIHQFFISSLTFQLEAILKPKLFLLTPLIKMELKSLTLILSSEVWRLKQHMNGFNNRPKELSLLKEVLLQEWVNTVLDGSETTFRIKITCKTQLSL